MQLQPLLTEQELFRLLQTIRQSRQIVVCAHRGPDGDAVGSSLALADYLQSLGKQVRVVLPNPFPDFLRWLPGSHTVQFYQHHESQATALLARADLVFCLDFSQPGRLQEMQHAVMASKAERVVIDHHLDPDLAMASQVYSFPSLCSTCEAVFRILVQLGAFDQMSKAAASCLYAGMMTDTGNFSYNSNNPDLYIILSELIKKGVDKDRIYTLAMNTSSEDRVRLLGYAMSEKMKVFPEYKAALITLTQDELQRFNYRKGDTESLVNIPLSIPEVQWSVFMREEPEYIKVSARSQGEFAVNRLCETYFSGGGHKNAAGGEYRGSMQQAIDTYMSILDTLKK